MNKIKEKFYLAKARAGDAEAFGKLYDFYVDQIYRFIYFKVSRQAEAEDLTSEVFLRAWQYLKDGVPIDNLKAFLYRLSRNVVIDFYRQNYSKKIVSLEDKDVIDNLRADNLIEQIDADVEIKSVLAKLDKIKEDYREVILLRYVEDYSIKEIAEIMNRSKGAVRVLLHRAIESLKKVVHSSAKK